MPTSDHARGGVKRRDDTAHNAFARSDDSASGITSNRTGTCSNSATDLWAGLIRTGGVTGGGATSNQPAQQSNCTDEIPVMSFHISLPLEPIPTQCCGLSPGRAETELASVNNAILQDKPTIA